MGVGPQLKMKNHRKMLYKCVLVKVVDALILTNNVVLAGFSVHCKQHSTVHRCQSG